MGGRFGKKKTQLDPNFGPYGEPAYGGYGMPPPYYGPNTFGEFPPYDPYEQYGYNPYLSNSFQTYSGSFGSGLGSSYGRGMSPWNYGNFYMGNTTLQMMPMMQRKVAKFAQRQGMLGGGFPPMMPMMPMMPCLPASFGMPMAAPMMAAATPLPMAYNPIVQNMYPMTMNSFNWMSPASFTSALSMGPMAYRPPASFEFPSNVGMVMPFPSSFSNPLFAPSSFGGFCPQYTSAGAMSCCCCYCLPPPVTYYPRPVPVPQPCPVPCPAPVPVLNVQQVPVPRQVNVVAPPIVAGGSSGFPVPSGAPLLPSQGGLTQFGITPSSVMKSNTKATTESLFSNNKPKEIKSDESAQSARRIRAQQLAASLSKLGLDDTFDNEIKPNKSKKRSSNKKYSSRHLSNEKYEFDDDSIISDIIHKSKISI